MSDRVTGTNVHVEGTSADASAGLDLSAKIYEPASTVTISGANRVLAVTDLTIISTASGTVTLLSKTATGTITLFAGVVAANGGLSRPFNLPVHGLRSGSLVLTAPAGRV